MVILGGGGGSYEQDTHVGLSKNTRSRRFSSTSVINDVSQYKLNGLDQSHSICLDSLSITLLVPGRGMRKLWGYNPV